MAKQILPLRDYSRVYQIVASILRSLDSYENRACLFYAWAGAEILKRFYQRDALIRVGAALYRVHDPTQTVLSFCQMSNGHISSSPTAFHAWVEAEGVVLDFMAPRFRESLSELGGKILLGRKMFQRPLSEMSESIDDLRVEGQFLLVPSNDLGRELLGKLYSKPAYGDLVEIACAWYQVPPKRIKEHFAIEDDRGERINMRLVAEEARSSW